MDRMEGQFLRKLREERGLSLREFAEKVYTSKSTVQRWEQTALPDDEETFARVAEALGMSADQLRADYQNFLTEREGEQKKKRENVWAHRQIFRADSEKLLPSGKVLPQKYRSDAS